MAKFLRKLVIAVAILMVPCRAGDTVAAAQQRLVSLSDEFGLANTPQAASALDGFWTAAQAWTIGYLNAHPGATAAALAAAAPMTGNVESTSATALAPGLIAVSVRYFQTGNIFLVGRRGGGFAVLWDIRRAGPADPAKNPWLASAAVPALCPGDCRALAGEVYALPPDHHGQTRFAVDAGYAQPAGATTLHRLSLWSFDGTTAKALLQQNYIHVADDHSALEVTANTIKAHIKSGYRMLAACGVCSGRKLTWTLRLGPDRIEDLGKTVDLPEMDTVDEALWRFYRKQPTAGLVTAGVGVLMGGLVDAARPDLDPKYPSLGMVESVTAARHGNTTVLTVDCDVDKAPHMEFTLEHQKTGWQITKMRISREN